MSCDLKLKSYLKDDICVIEVNCDIVFNCIIDMRCDIKKPIDECKNMLLDFSKVSIIDSAGVGFIVSLYKHMIQTEQGKFAICNVCHDIKVVFECTGLNRLFKVDYKSVDEAIEYMNS